MLFVTTELYIERLPAALAITVNGLDSPVFFTSGFDGSATTILSVNTGRWLVDLTGADEESDAGLSACG